MSQTYEALRGPRHLALVDPLARTERDEPTPAPAYLTTTRCRPSELPATATLTLTPMAADVARAAARVDGVELETWLRLAIECARQAERASELFNLAVGAVHRILDEAAANSPRTEPTAAAPLAAYVRALRAGAHAAGGGDAAGGVVVHVPDELVIAWNAAAVEARMALGEWASAHVLAAPAGVVAWEVAAARRGFYLGEWVLAESASSSAKRSRAAPQA
jgi:hypothetical protein